MNMRFNYKELKNFNLSKAIMNIYKHMIESNEDVEDLKFQLNVVEDKNGIKLNILTRFPTTRGTTLRRTYRINKNGKITSWVQDHEISDEDKKHQMLQETGKILQDTLQKLNLNDMLFHVLRNGKKYDITVKMEESDE